MADTGREQDAAASADAEPRPVEPQPVHRTEVVEGRVRRSPRYAVFLVLGAALGILVAAILTFAFSGNDEPAPNGAIYSDGEVFGFLALVGITVGIAVGGLVAIILDRTVGRRTRAVRLEHETVEHDD